MTESRLPCIWRCANCGSGVHEDEAVHYKLTDDIVCPTCCDELETASRTAYAEYCDTEGNTDENPN